jgi:hypothetical protein
MYANSISTLCWYSRWIIISGWNLLEWFWGSEDLARWVNSSQRSSSRPNWWIFYFARWRSLILLADPSISFGRYTTWRPLCLAKRVLLQRWEQFARPFVSTSNSPWNGWMPLYLRYYYCYLFLRTIYVSSFLYLAIVMILCFYGAYFLYHSFFSSILCRHELIILLLDSVVWLWWTFYWLESFAPVLFGWYNFCPNTNALSLPLFLLQCEQAFLWSPISSSRRPFFSCANRRL